MSLRILFNEDRPILYAVFLSLVVILPLGVSIAQAQPVSDSSRYHLLELGGFGGYSYTKNEQDKFFFGTFEKREKLHSISLQPYLGIFVSKDFQAVAEIGYTLVISNLNNYVVYTDINGKDEFEEFQFSYYQHVLTATVGILFFVCKTSRLWAFLGPKIGATWVGSKNELYQRTMTWSKPSLMFPEIVGGLKFFPESLNWSLNFRVQYRQSMTPNDIGDIQSDVIGVGIGFSVYISMEGS